VARYDLSRIEQPWPWANAGAIPFEIGDNPQAPR
jgi:hypothetical protein